jgi:hypothetical protein
MCLFQLIYTVRPCLIHTCHAAPMPCSDHAVLLKATAKHGRRETAGGPCPRSASSGYHAEFHEDFLSEAYQSSQRSIPTTVKSGSSTLKKNDLLNCWTSSDIFGYHANFHGHGTVGSGQGNGMACVNYTQRTAWHGNGMLCVTPPL